MGSDGELLSRFVTLCGFYKSCVGMFFRKLQIGGEETTWRRFTILPNIDGQKYTLGDKFTSREEQGEFIFLPRNTLTTDGVPVCEINVKRGKFFVTPKSRNREVSINDVKILKKTEMKFGDTLSIRDSQPHSTKNTFLFKERELNPEAFLDTPAAKFKSDSANTTKKLRQGKKSRKIFKGEFTPGQNGLILSHILSYFSVVDLKSCRLVAKLWNEEGFKLLKKRTRLSLDLTFSDYPDKSLHLFRYSVEMRNNPLSNWYVSIPSFPVNSNGTYPPDGSPLAIVLEDLSWFLFDGSFHNVTTLALGSDTASKFDYELNIKVLQTLQGTLEHLCLFGTWDISSTSNSEYQFPQTITFPRLKTFDFAIYIKVDEDEFDDDEARRSKDLPWIRNLVHGIKGVTSIRVFNTMSDFPTAVIFLQYLNLFADSFHNLEEFTFDNPTAEVINTFLKLNKPLKKLKVVGTHFDEVQAKDFSALDELFGKHAPTLESLEFIIPPSCWDIWGVRPPNYIHLPRFPNLIHLKVGWGQGDTYFRRKKTRLVFPGGGINWEKDFPSLKSLKLSCLENRRSWGESTWDELYAPLYQTFFPVLKVWIPEKEEIRICNSLQVLDIVTKVKILGGMASLFNKRALAAVAAMFPNASNYDWIASLNEATQMAIRKKKLFLQSLKKKPPSRRKRKSIRLIEPRTLRPRPGRRGRAE